MKTKHTIAATVITTATAAVLAGCASAPPRTVPAATVPIGVPAASPATTVVVPPAGTPTRVTYPQGAYELRGAGTPGSPYYWVWIPQGTEAPLLPPPPPLPPTR